MADFTSFLNILPDPNNPIGEAGEALSQNNDVFGYPYGTKGPGFASVTFTSEAPIQMSRSNSGRVSTRSMGGHKWTIQISYNPMTRDQFEPIYSFLLEQQGRLNPFFVQLPQHSSAKLAAFNTYIGSNAIDSATSSNAGVGFMLQDGHSSTAATQPKPGDMFTIADSNDSLHTKAYRVTRVMNSANRNTALHSAPSSTQRIVYFTPHLVRSVTQNAVIDYTPLIRVIQKTDVQQYSLGTNNLYQFSLNLEEAQA